MCLSHFCYNWNSGFQNSVMFMKMLSIQGLHLRKTLKMYEVVIISLVSALGKTMIVL